MSIPDYLSIMVTLEKQGKDGWELISFHQDQFYFKREIIEKQPNKA